MREYISLGVVVNTVSMLAANREGAIWISDVQEDATFYEARIADKRAVVIPAPSQAADVLEALVERGIQGVVATVTAPAVSSEHIFALGAGDVSLLLVLSKGLEQVLVNIVGRQWLDSCKRDFAHFQSHLLKMACCLGVVRTTLGVDALDEKAVLEIATQVISWSDFTLRDPGAIGKLYKDEGLADSLKPALERYEAAECSCTGQDAIAVLTAAIDNYAPRGVRPAVKVNSAELLRNLRIGYDPSQFESDPMFWQMRAWQRKWKYPLLQEWRALDPLGVLWDQRYWQSDLARLIADKSPRPIAAFKMDLDNFKLVNEALGHSGGDEAIRLYCDLIREVLGPIAEVYRRGGDEVVAFASPCTPTSARAVAEDVRVKIEERFAIWASAKDLKHPPTASIGLVMWDHSTSEEQVTRLLDEAQLEAKHEGKNRVVERAIHSDAG